MERIRNIHLQTLTFDYFMNIYLIGFMGSGKSLIGKRLAERLSLNFLDMDDLLVKKQGMSIASIFERRGEKYFRQLEANALRELANVDKTVVATGGGVPCFSNNMAWMNGDGVTIFLDVPVDVLAKRLENESATRPLLAGKSTKELKLFIKNKLEERLVDYGKAQFVCHADAPVDTLIDSLGRYFKRFVL